jgi:hypothetical protein
MTTLDKRVEALEELGKIKNDAVPLLNFRRWENPPDGLAFRIDGGPVIERLPDESDEAYQARSMKLAQRYNWGRRLPCLDISHGRDKGNDT